MRILKALQILTMGAIALSLVLTPASAQSIDEEELEFRYWRNLENGKALKAALIAVDDASGQIQLYVSGGKKYVVKVADYHEEDKAYVKEWISWKAEQAKHEAAKGAAGKAPDAADSAIRQALAMRISVEEVRGDRLSLGSSKEYPTDNEITVQVATRKGAASIPKGELHVVAYVEHDLTDARMRGSKAEPASGQESTSLKEVKQKAAKIESFPPGQAQERKFTVLTKQLKGEGNRKKGNKTYKFDWKYDQSLVGVRARLLIGGKLAAEATYPPDLNKKIARYD